jgi:Na+(H+)/acetate symporter ActP
MNTSQIENLPGVKWAMRHPRVAAWIVLSVGMVILLIIEARDVGLLATQWVALIAACVLVAGACVWIISWEDEDETPETPVDETEKPTEKPDEKTAP